MKYEFKNTLVSNIKKIKTSPLHKILQDFDFFKY